MKRIAKKLLLIGMAAALTLTLVSCDALGDNMIKDSQTYIQGKLDTLYMGKYSQEYMDLIDLTEEEAIEEHDDWLDQDVDIFCEYFSIDIESDEFRAQVVELYEMIYDKAKYTVKGSSKLDSGAYAVEVEVESMNVMDLVTSDDVDAMWEEVAGGVDVNDMSDEVYYAAHEAYGNKVVEAVKAQIPNTGYEPVQSVVFQIKEDTDGYYTMVSEDLINFSDYVIKY